MRDLVVPNAPSSGAAALTSLGRMPLHFEPNEGQADERFEFAARGPGYTIGLHDGDAVLHLRGAAQASGSREVRLEFVGANRDPQHQGQNELPGRVNYFAGSDAANWRTAIPTYARVRYEELYPGIDVVFYGNGRQLEYDFIIDPGVDPSRVRARFTGASRVMLVGRDLLVSTDQGEVRLRAPEVYQEMPNGRQTVAAQYALAGDGTVAFEVGAYDASRTLVIDPVLEYSSYVGGVGAESGHAIAIDSAGAVYFAGSTYGSATDTEDVYVTKLSADGSTLLYTTYLQGENVESGFGLAVHDTGAYVTGYTWSTTFPTLNAMQSNNRGSADAFVAKLDANGSIVYSTYFGGNGFNLGTDIAVDSTGAAYLTGYTAGDSSGTFPISAGAFQTGWAGSEAAFVTKISPDGSQLVYSTYLSGAMLVGDPSPYSRGTGIAVDDAGFAYVTGETSSPRFPVVNAAQAAFGGGSADAFVTKLAADGTALVYSTYLGGNDTDRAHDIAIEAAGSAYVTGATFISQNNSFSTFPTVAAVQGTHAGGFGDAFVTKVSADGSSFEYSTYLGGSDWDSGEGIGVDGNGVAHVAGWTLSTDFPTHNAIQPAPAGDRDAFLTTISADGSSWVSSSYLGGGNSDVATTVAVDAAGATYLAGHTGSSNFPVAYPMQGANARAPAFDAFVMKITDGEPDPGADPDRDEVPNAGDNCLYVANGTQDDIDGDGLGDLCDRDADGDGAIPPSDNCPMVVNDQSDGDSDGIGDACDPNPLDGPGEMGDTDGDGVPNGSDNCRTTANPDQADSDFDGVGDACGDSDGDGRANGEDNCPFVANADQADSNGDGIGDACPYLAVDLGGGEPVALNEAGQVLLSRNGRGVVWSEDAPLVDVGTLGGESTVPSALNGLGHVVGQSLTVDGVEHAFLWTPAQGMIDLTPFPVRGASATDVSDADQVVGCYLPPEENCRAFSWTSTGGLVTLDPLPGGTTNAPYGVNIHGLIVGTSSTADPYEPQHAVVWTSEGQMFDLGRAVPRALNDEGVVVGERTGDDGIRRPFIWTEAGGMMEPAVPIADLLYGRASAVNAGGDVLIEAQSSSFVWTSFLRTAAGEVHDLGTLGGSHTSAAALNDVGQSVGASWIAGDVANHAFVWTASGGMADLGGIGTFDGSPEFSQARWVNNAGTILGRGGHDARAVLWKIDFTNSDDDPLADRVDPDDDNDGIADVADAFPRNPSEWADPDGDGLGSNHADNCPVVSNPDQADSNGDGRGDACPFVALDLGTLGDWNFAVAVNDHGQVVGQDVLVSDGSRRAFSWTQAGGILDLGGPGDYSGALAVNNAGQVVGNRYTPDGFSRAFSWTAPGPLVDLPPLDGGFRSGVSETDFYARVLNDAGYVVGWSLTADGFQHAVLWKPGQPVVDLGTLGGQHSWARAVNNLGQVVGQSNTTGDVASYGFSWTAPGPMVALVPLNGGGYSSALAVNDAGQVVGYSSGSDGLEHAVLWNPGEAPIDLMPPGSEYGWARPVDVNAVGQVVGWAQAARGREHAFLWSEATGMLDLGTLGGWSSRAYDVNDSGQVVGWSIIASGATHAFSWTAETGMVDLGTLGGTYSEAFAVNNNGEIVGDAYLADNNTPHAVLWKLAIVDGDGDGIPDEVDPDRDGDLQSNADETACGSDPADRTSLSADFEGDHVPDCVDPNDDLDLVPDGADAFPWNSSEWLNTDGDGLGNNADPDDDNDDIPDAIDRDAANGADESLVASNDYRQGSNTFGTVTENGWRVILDDLVTEVKATIQHIGGLLPPAADITACGPSPKRIQLQYVTAQAEFGSARWSCNASGTLSGTALTSKPSVTILKFYTSFDGGGWGIAATPDKNQPFSVGSPVTAGMGDFEPMAVSIFDETRTEVGRFELDPGESVDVEIVFVGAEPHVRLTLENGDAVEVTVFGQTTTLRSDNPDADFQRDTAPPDIAAIADIAVEATSSQGAVVSFPPPVVTDDVDPTPTISVSPPSGSTFPLGDTIVTVTAIDDAGHSAIRTFSITVRDTRPPEITGVSVDRAVLWPPNHRMVEVMLLYGVSDAVDTTPQCAPSVTSNEPINGTGDGDAAPDWVVVDAHRVQLRAERAGNGIGRLYRIDLACTDVSGNRSSAQAFVRVPTSGGR